jgi:NAD(P)-dependent dehydrogenase (short-subunit alcohol dehydrogenase family)
MTDTGRHTALIIGASRALGLALAAELLGRDWNVIATVRGTERTRLHDLADTVGDRLTIESLDMTVPDEIAALRDRLAGRSLDLLFVNGAVTRGDLPIAEVPTEMFVEVMVTNALSPIRVIEALHDLVPASGTIGVMSSRQGSISLNTRGGQDLYRASKSALNQLMRSFAARHSTDTRTLLLMHPGWVKTGLGGSGAPLTIEQSAPGVVDTIIAHRGEPGLHFLDYRDEVVPW